MTIRRKLVLAAFAGAAALLLATTSQDGLPFVAVVTVVAVGLALAGGIAVAYRLTRPIEQAVAVIADGDFTRRLARERKDELGRMATALNRSVETMRSALHEVQSAAGQAAGPSPSSSTASDEPGGR